MDKRKPLPVNTDLKEYAAQMRKNPTPEEKIVWYQALKGRNPKFHRQRIIGSYIVDFYCPKLKLVIPSTVSVLGEDIFGTNKVKEENEKKIVKEEKKSEYKINSNDLPNEAKNFIDNIYEKFDTDFEIKNNILVKRTENFIWYQKKLYKRIHNARMKRGKVCVDIGDS